MRPSKALASFLTAAAIAAVVVVSPVAATADTSCAPTAAALQSQVSAEHAKLLAMQGASSPVVVLLGRVSATFDGNDTLSSATVRAEWPKPAYNSLWTSVLAELDRLAACRNAPPVNDNTPDVQVQLPDQPKTNPQPSTPQPSTPQPSTPQPSTPQPSTPQDTPQPSTQENEDTDDDTELPDAAPSTDPLPEIGFGTVGKVRSIDKWGNLNDDVSSVIVRGTTQTPGELFTITMNVTGTYDTSSGPAVTISNQSAVIGSLQRLVRAWRIAVKCGNTVTVRLNTGTTYTIASGQSSVTITTSACETVTPPLTDAGIAPYKTAQGTALADCTLTEAQIMAEDALITSGTSYRTLTKCRLVRPAPLGANPTDSQIAANVLENQRHIAAWKALVKLDRTFDACDRTPNIVTTGTPPVTDHNASDYGNCRRIVP